MISTDYAKWLLGPWLIGGFLDTLLQGILYCQFMRYAIRYRRDRLVLRIVVFVLFILTTLKSIHIVALVWAQVIDHFTDLDAAVALNYTVWWQSGSALMTATLDLYVQIFFVHRLYVISGRKWWVTVPICAALAFAYAAMCIATYYITIGVQATPSMKPWFAAHFGSVVGADVCLTITTTYFLLKIKRDLLPQTAGLFAALLQLTWFSAAPATVCAALNLIFSQVWPGTDRLLSVVVGTALPKVYAISMMWTLNARMKIRAGSTEYSIGQFVLNDLHNPIQSTAASNQIIQAQILAETRIPSDTIIEMHRVHTTDPAPTVEKFGYSADEKAL